MYDIVQYNSYKRTVYTGNEFGKRCHALLIITANQFLKKMYRDRFNSIAIYNFRFLLCGFFIILRHF